MRFFVFFSLILFFTPKVFSNEIEFDRFLRLIKYPNKIEAPCPAQTKDTAVILVIGQSNSANHAEKKFVTRYPLHVLNYFNGKCYEAASPLLGATGEEGEFLTMMGDFLIEFGAYKQVILVPSGINRSIISFWEKGGKYNSMLTDILNELENHYELTQIIWHQGESDYVLKTSVEKYRKSFYSLVDTLRKDKAIPIFYAIATRCLHAFNPDNPIANIQRTFADDKKLIYLGADTDDLVAYEERYGAEKCHFKEDGQIKTAYAFAQSIFAVNSLEKQS